MVFFHRQKQMKPSQVRRLNKCMELSHKWRKRDEETFAFVKTMIEQNIDERIELLRLLGEEISENLQDGLPLPKHTEEYSKQETYPPDDEGFIQ